uniref:Uncharacterized protein n=1 Tax=Arundo donax TaxID=35708 RepID=A0A0A9B2R2_ARUDO
MKMFLKRKTDQRGTIMGLG